MGLADPSAQAQPQTAWFPSSSLWGPPSPSPSGSQRFTGVCREGDSSPGALRAVGAAARIGVLRLLEEEGAQAPEAALGCVGDMAEAPRDAGLKQAPAPRNEKAPADFGYVGIDSILEQMRRKAMKQGFEFNIMVVGQSGLGKSTLINTLFKSKISRKSVQPTSEERIPKTIEIKSITHDIEEKGVRMKLTVIDTPGFGDHINNENCWQPIMKFINDQYEKYLQEEVNINRKKRIPDTRVHCCLYFIPATGHSLRPLDIEFMKRLSKVVNIVPVIAKADTLTLETHMQNIKDITSSIHFEAYRVKRLHEGSNAMSNGVEEKGPEAQEM
ncbi:septin-9-like [Leptonychotes weddellii]|uniref:Septin-9-like n=1 Tax=Leptonychotes weddellii TaxID=9713 RepID=A0A2U3YDF7_LEPWE|nr:septin-9-like [Leptonychotes weddellii]